MILGSIDIINFKLEKMILKVVGKITLIISIFSLLNSCGLDDYSKTEDNYGQEVAKYAQEYDLPNEYLKALIILECSGDKPAGQRFERNVYSKLQEVRDGKRIRYEDITRSEISQCSDAALRNLATSWGPFQIMGYKCIDMGIIINDLRGAESIKWGVLWINNEYGNLIRNNEFEKGFRMHNTGSENGSTFDPNYVSNGMEHIAYFEKNIETSSIN